MKMSSLFGILSLSLLLVAGSLSMCANSDADVQTLAASRVVSPAVDTISTSSSTDLITFALGTFRSEQKYEWLLTADSLSGGTTATCTLELNPDLDGNQWFTLGTVTVDGVSTISRNTGSFLYGDLRCRCSAASSTQSTAVYVDLTYTAD